MRGLKEQKGNRKKGKEKKGLKETSKMSYMFLEKGLRFFVVNEVG